MNSETNVIPLKNPKIITIILLSFLPLTGMTIDLFSPSLPAMSSALSLSDSLVKLVISIYLLGYAFGNFIIGLVTDAIGRKSLLRISAVLFTISSALPILFPNEVVLLAARFSQGFFIGSIAVLNRSIFSDTLPPQKLIKLGPTMGFLWGLGPIIGPILGGYFQHYYGWKSGFYFFTVISIVLLVLIYVYVPETIHHKSKLSIRKMKNDLTEVITNKEFMSLVIVMGIAYALIISFNTLGPFLIQDIMGYSPIFFGKLAILLGLAFLPAPILARKLLSLMPINKLFFTVAHSLFTIILIFLLLSIYFDMSLVLLILATITIYFTCGSIFPISLGKGLSMFRHISGTAAAIMYLFNMLITSLVAFIESAIHAHSVFTMILIYFGLMISILIVYWYKLKDL